MTVSKNHKGLSTQERAARPAEALSWLQRQLEWEAVLTRLRVAAGVLAPEAVRSAAPPHASAA